MLAYIMKYFNNIPFNKKIGEKQHKWQIHFVELIVLLSKSSLHISVLTILCLFFYLSFLMNRINVQNISYWKPLLQNTNCKNN